MKTFVVPTDFSNVANNASLYALALTKVMDGSLIFFHANEHDQSESLQKLQHELYALTGSNSHPNFNFISTDKLFNSLTIKEVLDEPIDLIIMGTNAGEAGLLQNIFGANTSEVIENLFCPLISVPKRYLYTPIKTIGYATDLNALNEELVKVIDFARPFNASIKVFHVSPIFPDLGDVEDKDIKSIMEMLRKQHNYPRMEYYVEKTSSDNQLNKGINHFLADHDLDLLVLFHNNEKGLNRFLTHSESETLVKDSDKPLLIFPKV
jgi:nucleotide-binding universal stress UspA family protein